MCSGSVKVCTHIGVLLVAELVVGVTLINAVLLDIIETSPLNGQRLHLLLDLRYRYGPALSISKVHELGWTVPTQEKS